MKQLKAIKQIHKMPDGSLHNVNSAPGLHAATHHCVWRRQRGALGVRLARVGDRVVPAERRAAAARPCGPLPARRVVPALLALAVGGDGGLRAARDGALAPRGAVPRGGLAKSRAARHFSDGRDLAAQTRGRSRASVVRQFEETVKPMYRKFIEPTRAFADLIVSGEEEVANLVRELTNRIGIEKQDIQY